MEYKHACAALDLLPLLSPVLEALVFKKGRLLRRWSTRRLVLKSGALLVYRPTKSTVTQSGSGSGPTPSDSDPPTHVFELSSHSFDLRPAQRSSKGALFTVSSPSRTHWFAVPEMDAISARQWVQECRRLARAVRSGPRLEDFTKLNELGHGGQGRVFLVKHNSSGKLYAVKRVLKRPPTAGGRAALRFRTSVEKRDDDRDLVKSLVHERSTLQRAVEEQLPFITGLEFSAQDATHWYLGLAYCAGGDLFKTMRAMPERRCSEEQVRIWGAQLVVALEHLHALGIAHRDIKPENVLLDSEGHVRLTDFGYAKELGVGGGRSNSFCGTKYYMPPEMLRAGQWHDTSVDWWSLGVLLYELLTGRPPWAIKNKMRLYDAILNEPVQFPDERITVSATAQSLIRGLLQKHPKKRLGCGSVGAVRGHPFFAGVDWSFPAPASPRRAAAPSPTFRRSSSVMFPRPVVSSRRETKALVQQVQQPCFQRMPSQGTDLSSQDVDTDTPADVEPLLVLGWDWRSEEFARTQDLESELLSARVDALTPVAFRPSLGSVDESDSGDSSDEEASRLASLREHSLSLSLSRSRLAITVST